MGTMMLAPEFVKNRLRPQIYKLAAEKMAEAGSNDEYWVEAVAETLMGDAEIEPVSDEGKLAASIVNHVLTKAREGSNDLVLDLLLWHRYCYGDEENVPSHVIDSITHMARSKSWKRRRSRKGLSRSRLR